MASDDMHTQLAGLLGKRSTDIMHIRMTHEDPPAISVIDVVQVITGMAKNNAGNYFGRMKTTHPEVSTNCRKYRFPKFAPNLSKSLILHVYRDALPNTDILVITPFPPLAFLCPLHLLLPPPPYSLLPHPTRGIR